MLGFHLCVVVLGLLSSVFAASVKTGSTVNLDGTFYFVPARAVSRINVPRNQLLAAVQDGEDLIPMTLMRSGNATFDANTLELVKATYLQDDDVFSPGFLQSIYLISSTSSEIHGSLKSALKTYNNKLFMDSSSMNCTMELPNGPYFMSAFTGNVFQAYRLYSDYEGAFTEGVIPDLGATYSTLSASVPGVQSPTIGVPSRLYYTKSKSQPLAGVRLGVKDIYDIAGTRRGCGNRAYYDLYGPKNTTAPAVQRLIDAGAVLIGKMKTSQFANGELATADWVDYHSPFNARGDGYSDPSSSSSGPGAGIGAYSWLDLGLGSDTGGSIRNPAQVNGAFGNRPSHGLVELTGVMPLSPLLDTAGFITRDAIFWKTAAYVLYGSNITRYTSFPKTLYTTGFPNSSTQAGAVLLSFLAKLETFLNTTSSELDYDALWANSTQAVETNTSTLEDLLTYTYPTLITKQQYALFGAPFIADYRALHDGRVPFIDPSPQARWAWGQTNATTLEAGINNKTIFMDWWNTEVIKSDPKTCSDSLLLYPGTLATPQYRNEYFGPPDIPSGFGAYNIAIFVEAPDMVLPVGQAPYNSTISEHVEYLPVAVDIIAHKGCDGMVFELAERLQNAGIIDTPKTGSTLYRREVGFGLE